MDHKENEKLISSERKLNSNFYGKYTIGNRRRVISLNSSVGWLQVIHRPSPILYSLVHLKTFLWFYTGLKSTETPLETSFFLT